MDKQKIKVIGSVVGIVMIVYILYAYSGSATGNTVQSDSEVVQEDDQLAQCLTEKGVVMYGTLWCSHCNNQKKLFGDSFQYATFVDCEKDREACIQVGIQGYPTWVIDGKLYPGERSLKELASLSRC